MSEPLDVATGVRTCVAAALARDVTTVSLDSNLMDDLGAESIDYLDIVFRLEQAFSIRITRGEMERAARGDMTAQEFAPKGVISERGLERLRELMPEAAGRISQGLRTGEILRLFSVQTFVNIINGKRDGRTV